MYTPEYFEQTNPETLHRFIAENSFAMLVGDVEGVPDVSHLPLLLEQRGDSAVLLGHFAKANDHWRHLQNKNVLAVFAGPHAYISPSWLKNENVVPTWNYLTVHVAGVLRLIEDAEQTLNVLRKTVAVYEADSASPWSMDELEPDFVSRLAGGVVAFEINVARMQGKWKLSQNHPQHRRDAIAFALRRKATDDAVSIAELMSPSAEDVT